MKQEHTPTILMKLCLSVIEYLENKVKPYFLTLSYQIFTIHQKDKKNSKLLFVKVDTGLKTYATYEYL